MMVLVDDAVSSRDTINIFPRHHYPETFIGYLASVPASYRHSIRRHIG